VAVVERNIRSRRAAVELMSNLASPPLCPFAPLGKAQETPPGGDPGCQRMVRQGSDELVARLIGNRRMGGWKPTIRLGTRVPTWFSAWCDASVPFVEPKGLTAGGFLRRLFPGVLLGSPVALGSLLSGEFIFFKRPPA